ncbi:MAG TPA: sigma-70 family RNA polymerase sigma factor [Planctomycetota bacterium]|nr:sigma-70 family RNA polymerase sigma factor [Planctomycetota bacterium]
MADEADLLVRASRGDQAAAGRIYDRHAPGVLRFLVLMLGEENTAEDVLQESFSYLFKNATRYDPARSSISTWLRQIAYSMARNELRRRRRRPSVSLEAPVPCDGGTRPLSELLAARESNPAGHRAAKALEVISRLPEDDRRVLILRHVEGCQPRQMARILGISSKAVSMRIWRALNRLRSELLRDSCDFP